MFDRLLLTSQRRVLQGPARWLSARGVSADSLTLCGFVFGLMASGLLAQQLYAMALAFIILNRIFDGLDGAVAHERSPTDRGAFMDIALDFFFYATIPFGFALADPAENALAASALLLAFVGTGSSFLAFSVIAAKRGISSMSFPQKGVYYLGGLTEGTETFVAFAAMCLWPASFAALAQAFTILALITTATRWWWGWRIFSEKKS
ncbi:MAG: CDP-alcohol phosphatidyltransferase family protein [Hyphomicrobiaceae bacterium]